MNCKPGEIAMLVRSTSGHGCVKKSIGTPVHLTQLFSSDLFGYGPAWEFRGRLMCPGCKREIVMLLDCDLQPMRPGPVADETPAQIIEELTCRIE